ncbi:MAG: transcription factor [Nitrososphaerota archaeon]|jgi:nascent polypeptide-associated complex subunit alpha|nr:transcription factor [Nitrososphaerota archaeon]
MMERMGLNMREIEGVKEVTIVTSQKEIHLKDAQVFEITAKGSRIFQVTASNIEESETAPQKFKEEDVALVMAQAGVSREAARAALEESNGDLALAIMRLSS